MIMAGKKLPEDYRLDALACEALRRSRKLGRPYSYGKLVAETTMAERDRIVEEYEDRKKGHQTR